MIVLWSFAVFLAACSASPVYDLTPPQQPQQQPQQPEYHTHKKARPYAFDYTVKDVSRALHFAQREAQDTEGAVSGEYRVLLPDGRTQVVNYTADHHHGFRATVTYQGEARPQGDIPEKYALPEVGESEDDVTDVAAVEEDAVKEDGAVVSEYDGVPVVTARVPEPTQSAVEPTQPDLPSVHRAQSTYNSRAPPRPSTGYLPAQPQDRLSYQYGAPPPPSFAPQPPRHAYLPPSPIYFTNRPTEAPLVTAAVVAEEEEEATAAPSGTTPGLPHGEPLPQFAVDPVPEAYEPEAHESGQLGARQPAVQETEAAGDKVQAQEPVNGAAAGGARAYV